MCADGRPAESDLLPSFALLWQLDPYLTEEPPFSELQRLYILLGTAGALRLVRGGGTWPLSRSRREQLAREKFALSSLVEQVLETKGSRRVNETDKQLEVVRAHPEQFPEWIEQLKLKASLHLGSLNQPYSYEFNTVTGHQNQ